MSTSKGPSSGVDVTQERPQKKGGVPWLIMAVALVLVALAGLAIGYALAGDDGAASDANELEPATVTEPDNGSEPATIFGPGTVMVSISGIDDAAGSYLAGVLWQGEWGHDNAVGGFAVEVDSDSFAPNEVVRELQPDPDSDTLFPYVSEDPLVVEPDSYILHVLFAPSKMSPYSGRIPADQEGLTACEIRFSLDTGAAVHVRLTDLPSAGPGGMNTCPALSWQTIPSSSREREEDEREEEAWMIVLDRWEPGVHTVFMIKAFSPLREAEVQQLGGRLVWEDTEIDLCRIGVRYVGDGFLQIGDIFETTEGCGTNTGMQQAFDELGLPATACVFVRAHGVDDEYCAPLAVD